MFAASFGSTTLTSTPGTAQAWVAKLNAERYGGFDDWTLPTGDGLVSESSPNYSSANQLGALFFHELGNTEGSTVTNLGPFTALGTNADYWSSSSDTQPPGYFWLVSTHLGQEFAFGPAVESEVIPMRVGVAPIPIPGSIWLLASALMFALALKPSLRLRGH